MGLAVRRAAAVAAAVATTVVSLMRAQMPRVRLAVKPRMAPARRPAGLRDGEGDDHAHGGVRGVRGCVVRDDPEGNEFDLVIWQPE
jgi:hypothetical protein